MATEISVICTAKNAATTIERTIRSIIAQDFENWEMIVVDDGSTDDTADVVARLAAEDGRVRLIASGGVGRGRALNRALAEAEADLIANMDADDEAHPLWLRLTLRAMAECPPFGIMSTDWIRVVGDACPEWPEIDPNASLEVEDVTRALAFYNPIYHSSVLMNKAALLALGGYDESLRFVFDYDLWERSAAAGIQLGRLRHPLVGQRVHPNQAYLHSQRLSYILAGARVQKRAMGNLGITKLYLPLTVLRVAWGMLPLKVRLALRDLASWRVAPTRSR